MITQTGLVQLKIYVSSQQQQLCQKKASAKRLSVSRYVRSLIDADVDGQADRNQRIAAICRQLVHNLADQQEAEPNPQDSDLFTDSIALVRSIQQEVSGA